MASNVLGGNAEETDKAPKSGLKNAAAGIALGVTLALAGTPAGAAETTAQMEAAREMCLADSKAKSTSLLKLAETKRAAAAEFEKAGEGEKAKVEMEKVAKLEKKFQELVESCMELVVVQNRSREADARIASADAKIASADADIIKLDRIKKEGDEINLEFQTLTQALNDYSIGKITAEQFKSKITNVWLFFERVRIHIIEARGVMTDSKYIQMYNQLEQSILKFSQNPNIPSLVKTVKK